jgi:hypothetical protein
VNETYSEQAWHLLESALGDPDLVARASAMWGMAARGSESAPFVGQVLFGDPDPLLRIRAIDFLSLDDSPAATAVLHSAIDDPDPEVSAEARLAVQGRLDRGHTVESTAQATRPEEPFNVQLAVERAVQAQILVAEAESRMTGFVDHLERDVLPRALGAVVASNPDVRVREGTIYALVEIGAEVALKPSKSALGDYDHRIWQLAVTTLWELGGREYR